VPGAAWHPPGRLRATAAGQTPTSQEDHVSDNNLYAVFSRPPEGVSWEDYDRWYHMHCRENVQSRGMVAVQRYGVKPVVVGSGVGPSRSQVDPNAIPYNHLGLFQFQGTIEDVRADLSRRVSGGDIVLPDWFNNVQFSTWACTPIDELVEHKD
jgi:hypothetical protein